MQIALSEHFTYGKLFKFTLPSVLMMVFISIYSVVDGWFVSNFVGSEAFAAISFIYPFLMFISAIGFMFASGGCALVAKILGEKNLRLANRIFSLVIYTTFLLGIFLSFLALIFINPILNYLGLNGNFYDYSLIYAKILFISLPFFMLQIVFQSFFVVNEKPKLGLYMALISGFINILLDAIFIVGFKWGISGAAWATLLSQLFGAIYALLFFVFGKNNLLRLGKTQLYIPELIKITSNGFSEYMTNLSISFVTMVYNYQLLNFAGADGIAAFGVIGYINFIFISAFLGYTIGNNPLISYNYGAKNYSELQSLFKKNIIMIVSVGIIMFLLSEICADFLVKLFVGYDKNLTDLTISGLRIYAISFLICGFNVYASAFFTALNNGVISALISFARTIIFECSCVLILPLFWGVKGIWVSIIVAEIMALFLSVYFIRFYNSKYHYLK